MTVDRSLDELAEACGILDSYCDLSGTQQIIGPDTKKALLRANGVILDNEAMIGEALAEVRARLHCPFGPAERIVRAGQPVLLDVPGDWIWRLQLDGATGAPEEGRARDKLRLPGLPAGVHVLTLAAGQDTQTITLIAAPEAAPTVRRLAGRSRLWGINAALYSLRSQRDLGVGDYADLAQAAEAFAAQGAGFVGINPVHALGWSDIATISPYSPSDRRFLNAWHIAADLIPGLEGSQRARALFEENRQTLTDVLHARRIDHARHRAVIAPLLAQLFELFEAEAGARSKADFAGFVREKGPELDDFALFEALSEAHGPEWRNWPRGLQSARDTGVPAARQRLAGRVRFHAWLQWVADCQLAGAQSRARAAGMPLGLYLDLAVGPRRGASETWCNGDSIARGVSIGAPPDHLNPGGQNWDLAAYMPAQPAAGGYRAFRQVLRATMRHAGLIRIDHVLGMNRSFWIPDDGSPGGYIRQPFEALIALIAIEAERAGCVVIGEDLGLVPDGFRDAINARGLYSYAVLRYEQEADGRFRQPDGLRRQSMACFGTHDTPTIAGFRIGRDIDWWQRLGWIDRAEAGTARRKRATEVASLTQAVGLNPEAGGADLAEAVHRALARSPVAMVSVQLDDLGGETEAQNLPGTIHEHPNWRRRGSVPLEDFGQWPALSRVARVMRETGRDAGSAEEEEKTHETGNPVLRTL